MNLFQPNFWTNLASRLTYSPRFLDSGGNETLNFLEGGGKLAVVVADVDDSAVAWVGGVRENEEAVGE